MLRGLSAIIFIIKLILERIKVLSYLSTQVILQITKLEVLQH